MAATSEDSILDTIKLMLGIDFGVTAFDKSLIQFINTAISEAVNVGFTPVDGTPGYEITDNTAKWSDFIGEGKSEFNLIKSYIYLKVKIMFDPPQSSSVLASYKESIKEYEYRIYTMKGGY